MEKRFPWTTSSTSKETFSYDVNAKNSKSREELTPRLPKKDCFQEGDIEILLEVEIAESQYTCTLKSSGTLSCDSREAGLVQVVIPSSDEVSSLKKDVLGLKKWCENINNKKEESEKHLGKKEAVGGIVSDLAEEMKVAPPQRQLTKVISKPFLRCNDHQKEDNRSPCVSKVESNLEEHLEAQVESDLINVPKRESQSYSKKQDFAASNHPIPNKEPRRLLRVELGAVFRILERLEPVSFSFSDGIDCRNLSSRLQRLLDKLGIDEGKLDEFLTKDCSLTKCRCCGVFSKFAKSTLPRPSKLPRTSKCLALEPQFQSSEIAKKSIPQPQKRTFDTCRNSVEEKPEKIDELLKSSSKEPQDPHMLVGNLQGSTEDKIKEASRDEEGDEDRIQDDTFQQKSSIPRTPRISRICRPMTAEREVDRYLTKNNRGGSYLANQRRLQSQKELEAMLPSSRGVRTTKGLPSGVPRPSSNRRTVDYSSRRIAALIPPSSKVKVGVERTPDEYVGEAEAEVGNKMNEVESDTKDKIQSKCKAVSDVKSNIGNRVNRTRMKSTLISKVEPDPICQEQLYASRQPEEAERINLKSEKPSVQIRCLDDKVSENFCTEDLFKEKQQDTSKQVPEVYQADALINEEDSPELNQKEEKQQQRQYNGPQQPVPLIEVLSIIDIVKYLMDRRFDDEDKWKMTHPNIEEIISQIYSNRHENIDFHNDRNSKFESGLRFWDDKLLLEKIAEMDFQCASCAMTLDREKRNKKNVEEPEKNITDELEARKIVPISQEKISSTATLRERLFRSDDTVPEEAIASAPLQESDTTAFSSSSAEKLIREWMRPSQIEKENITISKEEVFEQSVPAAREDYHDVIQNIRTQIAEAIGKCTTHRGVSENKFYPYEDRRVAEEPPLFDQSSSSSGVNRVGAFSEAQRLALRRFDCFEMDFEKKDASQNISPTKKMEYSRVQAKSDPLACKKKDNRDRRLVDDEERSGKACSRMEGSLEIAKEVARTLCRGRRARRVDAKRRGTSKTDDRALRSHPAEGYSAPCQKYISSNTPTTIGDALKASSRIPIDRVKHSKSTFSSDVTREERFQRQVVYNDGETSSREFSSTAGSTEGARTSKILPIYRKILESNEEMDWESFQELVETLHPPSQKELWCDICKAVGNEAKRVACENGVTTEVCIEINPVPCKKRRGKVKARSNEICFEMDMALEDVESFLDGKLGRMTRECWKRCGG